MGKDEVEDRGGQVLVRIVVNPVFMSLLSLLYEGPSRKAVLSVALVCAAKGMGDYYLGRRLGTSLNPFAYLLAPFKDLLIGILWFVPMASNTVVWRENRYSIGKEYAAFAPPGNGVVGLGAGGMVDGLKERMAWSLGSS